MKILVDDPGPVNERARRVLAGIGKIEMLENYEECELARRIKEADAVLSWANARFPAKVLTQAERLKIISVIGVVLFWQR